MVVHIGRRPAGGGVGRPRVANVFVGGNHAEASDTVVREAFAHQSAIAHEGRARGHGDFGEVQGGSADEARPQAGAFVFEEGGVVGVEG